MLVLVVALLYLSRVMSVMDADGWKFVLDGECFLARAESIDVGLVAVYERPSPHPPN